MRVLVVEPMEAPYVSEIGSSLEDLQNAVGGWSETIYPFDDNAAVICNEEGKLNGLDLNRAMRDETGAIYDVIAGKFLVAGMKDDEFSSLSQEQIETYAELYKNPEVFLMRHGKVKAIPITPIHTDPIVKNVYEETKDGVRLEIREDPDPVNPRTLSTKFGTMVLFGKYAEGDPHRYPNPEVFFLDRLAEHLGSVEKAEKFIRNSLLAYSKKEIERYVPWEANEESIIVELLGEEVFVPVYWSMNGDGVKSQLSRSWQGSKQIGYIYATKEEIAAQFGDASEQSFEEAEKLLEEEVDIYGDYLKGENYVYDLIDEKSGKILDGGFWTGDVESLRKFAFDCLPPKEHVTERGPER